MTHIGIRGVDTSWLQKELLKLGIDVECELCGGAGWTWLPYLGVVTCRCRQREVRA